MPNSIWDTRFTRKQPALALDAAVVDAFFALDDWITIHGAHVEIDGDGNVLHGAGGKFAGTNYYKYMREKANTEKGKANAAEIKNDFNTAEYKDKVKNYIAGHEKAAERDAKVVNKQFLETNLKKLDDAKKAYEDAKARGLTRQGLARYENKIIECKKEADRYRTPEELRQMAKTTTNGYFDEKYYNGMVKEAKAELEERTRRYLNERLYEEFPKNADFDIRGEISYEGGRKQAISNFIEENASRKSQERELELSHVREYEQAKQAEKRSTRQPDAAGQKSIFGGSGWW